MISPELRPDAVPSCPPAASGGRFNENQEHEPSPGEQRQAVGMGSDMTSRRTTDAVVNGLWHTLLGSLVAGLAVSAALGVVVLVIGQLG